MTARLRIDEAGRVAIPESLREELRLEPGDTLELESTGEAITLRPVRAAGSFQRELGVWVLRTGEPMAGSATDEVLQDEQERRDARIGMASLERRLPYENRL